MGWLWTDERTARLLHLIDIEGLSYTEAGGVLGVSRVSIAGQLYRLRQAKIAPRVPAVPTARPSVPRSRRYRFRNHKTHSHSLPIVNAMFLEMNVQQCTLAEMSERSGVGVNTLKTWQKRGNPRFAMIEACFNVLGLELKPVPRKD